MRWIPMRWSVVPAVLALVGVGPLLAGCGEPSPEAKRVGQKAGETFDAMKAWGVDKRDDFVRSASATLESMKSIADDAKRSATGASADAARTLDDDWKVVQQKLDVMKTATGDRWASARDDFLAAYATFRQKVAAAAAR
jgi:hypothetical protein